MFRGLNNICIGLYLPKNSKYKSKFDSISNIIIKSKFSSLILFCVISILSVSILLHISLLSTE